MRISCRGGRHSWLNFACPLIVAAQLTGCGGGGGGTGGDGGPTPPPAPPAPTTVSLTLSGAVTDAPIPGAEVTATVGEQTFTATADASGNYNLEIEIEEADADGFVTLEARGVNDQSFVTFISMAGSFASLAEQAGDDETLSSAENFATQITNVSTAEAVLLQEANDGQAITSDDELQSLGPAINAQDVLDLATAIKLSVDSAEDYPLPEGTTLLDIVSDPAVWPQFVADAHDQDPAAFTATQTAIAQDPTLTRPVTVDDVPRDLKIALMSPDPGLAFNLVNRASAYTFNGDGTGIAASGTFVQEMTWNVDGANIVVTYSEPVETFAYPSEDCDGTVRQVQASFVSQGVRLTLLSDRTIALTETTDVTYLDCPSLAARESTETTARSILSTEDFHELTAEEMAGSAQTLYVYDVTRAVDPVVADIADLGADGTGTTRLLGKSFTWSVEPADREIVLTFADGTVGRYQGLRDVDDLATDIFFEIETSAGEKFVDANVSVSVDPEYALEFTQSNVVGRHYQFGIGEGPDADPRLDGFFLRLDEGGTGAQVYDYVDTQGNIVVVDETVEPGNALRWSIETDDLVLRRTYGGCLFGTAECVLYDERRQIPLGSFDIASGSRSWVLEQRQFDLDGVGSSTPATYLVRFYDTEQETLASASSAKALTSGKASQPRIARQRGRQVR